MSVVEEAVDVRVKPFHDRAQEDRCVPFRAAVRVNFDEHPFGTPFDAYAYVNPRREPVSGWKMGGRIVKSPVFEPWQNPPNAP